jgi:membrane protease YdiL (CAAX protease family)
MPGVSSEPAGAMKRGPWGLLAALTAFVGFVVAQIAAASLIGPLAADLGPGRLGGNWVAVGFYLTANLLNLVLIVMLLRVYRAGWRSLGFSRVNLKWIAATAPALLLYGIVAGLILAALAWLAPSLNLEEAQELGFDETARPLELAAIFAALVVAAPMVEEMVFRGFILTGLRRRLPFWPAALISSALFGLAHFQLNVSLYTFGLALVLAWLYKKSGSLWPPIILHGLKNLLAFALLYL